MGENMKKKIKRIMVATVCFILVVLCVIYNLFFNINTIKPGELISQVDSPDGKNSINCYLNNGGATTSYFVLCTLYSNESGKEKNIFWAEDDSAIIKWIDDDTVVINGIKLDDVKKDTYDFRREK